MPENNGKDSLSVKEIEAFAKKNRFQVVFGLAILLATIFSYFLSMMGYCVLTTCIGTLLGVFLSIRVESFAKRVFQFILKQEQATQLVLGAVLLILAIFLSPLVFLMVGMHGGKDLKIMATTSPTV